MDLPVEFLERMKHMLGEEFDAFLKSYDQPKAYGLRINPLKCGEDFSTKDLPFTLRPVEWAEEGFYAELEERPGKHPLHEGGAYYIQEPSAMSVVSLLAPEPGDKVCDLCAAPGGKSTHIAGRLLGKGLLVSNEIFPARAKILSQNLERFGAGNCVVCNEPPDKMASHFPLFFDKIVVDAPCSGEGMFRKDDTAIQEWTPNQVTICKERQEMILECADQMLAPGGIMVYSTCTFAPEEDEQMILWFLTTHPDYELEDWQEILPADCGLESGRESFLNAAASTETATGTEGTFCTSHNSPLIAKTLRLWPHKLHGEGHFAARLRKKGSLFQKEHPEEAIFQTKLTKGKKKTNNKKKTELTDYEEFIAQFLTFSSKTDTYSITSLLSKGENYQYFGDELYLVPDQMNTLAGLKTVRPGLHLGTRKKNRFEPAHALAMALKPEDVTQYTECSLEDALRYLKGETISCSPEFKSWTLVSYQGISLGWGKAQNGNLKNHYPKGLRIF